MKFKILLIGFTILWVSSTNLYAQIITDSSGNQVSQQDIDFILKIAPAKAQLDLIENRSKFKEKLIQVYLTKAIAAEGKEKKLSEAEIFELNQLVDNYYFHLVRKRLSTEKLPNFEPLAKLNYSENKKD